MYWTDGLARHACGAALALLLLACASPPPAAPPPAPPAPPRPESYLVLLSNDDGSTGKVQLTTSAGTTQLDQNRQGSNFAGPAGQTFAVAQDKIERDFGAALAAMPTKPQTFLLYFEVGGAKLNPESEALLPRIFEAINARSAPDISITGHTDTVGDDGANERLALERARFVAALINSSSRIDASKIAIESHGEKNLLVPTPDNTSEARNRRVEVTVR
jgi:peptidoglycan-associated lipoprotein